MLDYRTWHLNTGSSGDGFSRERRRNSASHFEKEHEFVLARTHQHWLGVNQYFAVVGFEVFQDLFKYLWSIRIIRRFVHFWPQTSETELEVRRGIPGFVACLNSSPLSGIGLLLQTRITSSQVWRRIVPSSLRCGINCFLLHAYRLFSLWRRIFRSISCGSLLHEIPQTTVEMLT